MRIIHLTLIFTCLLISVSCKNAQVPNGYKNCFGKNVSIEYVPKKPISKALADSIKVGDEMRDIINRLKTPSQDSGTDKYIWHYMVEGGTYLMIVGHDKAEEVRQYDNNAIR